MLLGKQRESDDPSIPAGTAQPDDTMEAGEIDWAALLLATSGKLKVLRGELENLSDI